MFSAEINLLCALIKMLNGMDTVPTDSVFKIQFGSDRDTEMAVSELMKNNREVKIGRHNFAFKVRGNQVFFWVNQ